MKTQDIANGQRWYVNTVYSGKCGYVASHEMLSLKRKYENKNMGTKTSNEMDYNYVHPLK